MPTLEAGAEARNLLRDVSWDTYVRLCEENSSPATRLTYFRGDLEIMTVSGEHDQVSNRIQSLFETLAECFGINYETFGSTTYWSETGQIGFEPDCSFYVGVSGWPVHGGPSRLPSDRPPDLVIEVDISRSSLNKLPAYAGAGVREAWRYHRGRIQVFSLSPTVKEIAVSSILDFVSGDDLTMLLDKARTTLRIDWLPFVREWARNRRAEQR